MTGKFPVHQSTQSSDWELLRTCVCNSGVGHRHLCVVLELLCCSHGGAVMHSGCMLSRCSLRFQFFQNGERIEEKHEDDRLVLCIQMKGQISARITNNGRDSVRIWFAAELDEPCPENTPILDCGEAMPYAYTPAYVREGIFYCLIQKNQEDIESIPIWYGHVMPPQRAKRLSEITS